MADNDITLGLISGERLPGEYTKVKRWHKEFESCVEVTDKLRLKWELQSILAVSV